MLTILAQYYNDDTQPNSVLLGKSVMLTHCKLSY